MKARQFCSVCKQWLDMEVVPTGDGDEDDGVIWFRCPQCQGFLPKLGGDAALSGDDDEADAPAAEAPESAAKTVADELPWDSPADMMAARDAGGGADVLPGARGGAGGGDEEAGAAAADGDAAAAEEPAAGEKEKDDDVEPVAEYAAQLAAADASTAVPYRPSASYDVGQCVHHLAWDDVGVVVGKESLPGGRRVIKCYFDSAGVVRLIEEAPE